jgi:aminocarboxymuconate-semialdehyde decarboxylase
MRAEKFVRSPAPFAARFKIIKVGRNILPAIHPYGPTAARSHRKLGREVRPRSLTIDIHAHVSVPAAAILVAPHLDLSTIPLAFFSTPETTKINRQQEVDRGTRLSGADAGLAERLRDLDDMGVDRQLVMPPPPQCYYTVPLDIGVKATRLVNDGIAEFVDRAKDRFIPVGGVPMQDGHEAAKELERIVQQLGFKGAEVLTNVAGRELSDEAYAPFWAKAEELGALIVLHPNGFTEAKRMARFYFNNIIGNPLETTLALHYLIFDGVLERHPGLKILAAHGGGYLGSYSGRIDHAWGARMDCNAELPRPPTHYLKKVFVDSVVFTPQQLEDLVKVFGADHVIMGTDYPYDMAEYDPIGHVASVETFDAATIAAIAGGNAKRLLGL